MMLRAEAPQELCAFDCTLRLGRHHLSRCHPADGWWFMSTLAQKNRRLVTGLGFVVIGMVGMSYAAVPLYDLFCRVTGFGGTTQIASERSNTVSDRPIKVRFDAMTTNIDWAFSTHPTADRVEGRRKRSGILPSDQSHN